MRFSIGFVATLIASLSRADGKVTFEITDGDGEPIPARVHLRDEAGQAVKSLGLTDRLDHLTVDGKRTVSVPAGTYLYGIERSPEWVPVDGEATVGDSETTIAATLERLVDLSQRGWYSGDLHIHRDPAIVGELLEASDLHIGPVITWWNDSNLWKETPPPDDPLVRLPDDRFAHLVAGEDEREGGALLYFGMDRPIDITGAGREFPSPMTFLEQAREQTPDLHLDIEKPFWWDVPLWLALAEPDTIGLANNHMCRDRMYENEAWGKPRDLQRLPNPRGNGYWTQEIYYHILNAGFRLPPSAGSASGVLPNPVGYNRVYVHVDGELTWDKWWEGLRAGRSFVTNGPVLLASASMVPKGGVGLPVQSLPGTVFQSDEPATLRISVNVELWTTDDISQLELIHNGEVAATVECTDDSYQAHTLPLEANESGWFLVRAITDNPRTFRFASSAPFYIEIGGEQRISRTSCQFFLDWVRERMARVPDKLSHPEQLKTVLDDHRQAEMFWEQRMSQNHCE